MELDEKNIKRLVRFYGRYFVNNWRKLAVKIAAYAYLIGVFGFLATYCSYHFRIASEALSFLFTWLATSAIYLVYVILNHTVVSFAVNHKTLLLLELLTLVMIICIFTTNLRLHN